jgi:hypothetical protein
MPWWEAKCGSLKHPPIYPTCWVGYGQWTYCILYGKSVTLNANKGVGYTYQWKKAGVNIAGATQSSYTINTSGYYSVLVKDAFGLSATSETVIVNVVNPPLATVGCGRTAIVLRR